MKMIRRLFQNKKFVIRVTAAAALAVLLIVAGVLLPSDTRAASWRSGPANTVDEIHQAFPESYWAGLEALHEAHPTWRFVAFNTGLNWGECFGPQAELYLTRNLVYTGSDPNNLPYPTSWYSTDIPGAYNWAANAWTAFDSSTWYQASQEAIAYCMDPRNFLTEENIFMFVDGGAPIEDKELSMAAIRSILQRTGIPFWNQLAIDTDIYTYEEVPNPAYDDYLAYLEYLEASKQASEAEEQSSIDALTAEAETDGSTEAGGESTDANETGGPADGSTEEGSGAEESTDPEETTVPEEDPSTEEATTPAPVEPMEEPPRTITVKRIFTYAEAIEEAADIVGVNQPMIASRLMQEQGKATSPLISGTQSFTLENGTFIGGGYYNYFNIGAYGNSRAEIINNGLIEAYNEGWNTRYKALVGGAAKYMRLYISRQQTTLYSQKFNVDSSSNRLWWGQYMQNLTAPQSECKILRNSLVSSGALELAYTFIIPVFSDMPSDVSPYPSRDGNPNYKLGAINVNDAPLASFNMDKTEYGAVLDLVDVQSVPLEALSYAGTSTLKVTSEAQGLVTECAVVKNVNNGQGFFSTDVPLAPGNNIIEVTCTAENGISRSYKFSINLTITVLPPPPTEEETTAPEETTGADETTSSEETTGSENETTAAEGETTAEAGETTAPEETTAPVITADGDPNGDGSVDVFDITMMRSHILGYRIMTPEEFARADVDRDGDVSVFDITRVRAFILGYSDTVSN